jgi:hypothetical protein
MNAIRIVEAVHGHVGFLAAAALYHPAILLRRGQQLSRGARYALALSTGFAVAAFSLGISIYEGYRSVVKQNLFRINMDAGFSFETKEHLAFIVVVLAVGAMVCAFSAPKEARSLRQAAAATYLTAALLATTVCILGTYVAAVHTFPE